MVCSELRCVVSCWSDASSTERLLQSLFAKQIALLEENRRNYAPPEIMSRYSIPRPRCVPIAAVRYSTYVYDDWHRELFPCSCIPSSLSDSILLAVCWVYRPVWLHTELLFLSYKQARMLLVYSLITPHDQLTDVWVAKPIGFVKRGEQEKKQPARCVTRWRR